MEDIDLKNYTTDGKTQHLSSEEDINTKLINIIGKKFADYRKLWDHKRYGYSYRFSIVSAFRHESRM